ncbi:nucleotidyltransferase domain-containing protein [Candidatus Haliotispira prima]|uniref:Nucleotidyltransferase domain-containing protein n=1 Tax=Candidatus Haliotispira prima TaxID=3034016 RepID=A0ABY8MI99_9SPIO|nr:nucleotidyltransferase domain-containing protein [Candidatus Haliotispira prima]
MPFYALGSQANHNANANSDLDLAVLVATYVDPPDLLWHPGSELSLLCHCQVDLLNFCATSTVMQYQILTRDKRLWCLDFQADLYEAAVLNEKIYLDERRAPLLRDIAKIGKIYG